MFCFPPAPLPFSSLHLPLLLSPLTHTAPAVGTPCPTRHAQTCNARPPLRSTFAPCLHARHPMGWWPPGALPLIFCSLCNLRHCRCRAKQPQRSPWQSSAGACCSRCRTVLGRPPRAATPTPSRGASQQGGVEPVQPYVLHVLLKIVQLLVPPLAQQLQHVRQQVQGARMGPQAEGWGMGGPLAKSQRRSQGARCRGDCRRNLASAAQPEATTATHLCKARDHAAGGAAEGGAAGLGPPPPVFAKQLHHGLLAAAAACRLPLCRALAGQLCLQRRTIQLHQQGEVQTGTLRRGANSHTPKQVAACRRPTQTHQQGHPAPRTSRATESGQAASIRSANRRPAPSSPSASRSLAW